MAAFGRYILIYLRFENKVKKDDIRKMYPDIFVDKKD